MLLLFNKTLLRAMILISSDVLMRSSDEIQVKSDLGILIYIPFRFRFATRHETVQLHWKILLPVTFTFCILRVRLLPLTCGAPAVARGMFHPRQVLSYLVQIK